MDERHPTAHTLERLLAAVHAGTRAVTHDLVMRVHQRIDSQQMADFFEEAANNLVPRDPTEREFVERFIRSTSSLQIRNLLDRVPGKLLCVEQYEELIRLMEDVRATPSRGASFLFLREEYLSQVDLKKLWSGMKGDDAAVFWRWLKAAEAADREAELDPAEILDDAALFEPVLRRAMTASEYRATFLELQTRPMKELYALLQVLVREDLARIWNVSVVP